MLIEIVYILTVLAYLTCFCAYAICLVKFNLAESPFLVMLWSFSWPLIFVASLFSLPFLAFIKLIREDKKNDT